MATVIQIIATDENNRHFEREIAEADEWHAMMSSGDAIRTVCGIQLEGDDGYAAGMDKQGKVTCEVCRSIIEEIQSIKRWK